MTFPRFQQDGLTGLLTRKLFFDQIVSILQEAKDQPVSLAFLDLDRFKEINDHFGHQAGDELLKSVAQQITEIAGENAYISRVGGDEFGILLPNMEREQAFLMLERIRARVESKPILPVLQGPEICITLSAGIASSPIDAHGEVELTRKADQALYRAKSMGGNNVRLAYEEKMIPKTSHFTVTQLERLSGLAQQQGRGDAELLREALDNLLIKYGFSDVEPR